MEPIFFATPAELRSWFERHHADRREPLVGFTIHWVTSAKRPETRERRLLLTPVLRRALRWNHVWAIARAREALEPYAPAAAARVPTTAR